VILGHKSTTELSKAFDVLKNTIIDLYPQIGKDVLLSVGSTIKDFHELNAICKKRVLNLFEFGVDEAKYKNNDEDLYPNNIQVNPDDVDEGLFKLLSLLGIIIFFIYFKYWMHIYLFTTFLIFFFFLINFFVCLFFFFLFYYLSLYLYSM
jgi:hypothetical protein